MAEETCSQGEESVHSVVRWVSQALDQLEEDTDKQEDLLRDRIRLLLVDDKAQEFRQSRQPGMVPQG